jgi:hypothetical protein
MFLFDGRVRPLFADQDTLHGARSSEAENAHAALGTNHSAHGCGLIPLLTYATSYQSLEFGSRRVGRASSSVGGRRAGVVAPSEHDVEFAFGGLGDRGYAGNPGVTVTLLPHAGSPSPFARQVRSYRSWLIGQ